MRKEMKRALIMLEALVAVTVIAMAIGEAVVLRVVWVLYKAGCDVHSEL